MTNMTRMAPSNEPLVDTQDALAKVYGIYPLLDPYYLRNREASMRRRSDWCWTA